MLARNEWIPPDEPTPPPEPPKPLYLDFDAVAGGILMLLSVLIAVWFWWR